MEGWADIPVLFLTIWDAILEEMINKPTYGGGVSNINAYEQSFICFPLGWHMHPTVYTER